MSQSGVAGRPTLVQNVESLACAALIARFGDRWYRSAGRYDGEGTALVTVSGAVPREGVCEIELGTPLADVVANAGGTTGEIRAVILGGYFGTWSRAREVWDMPLDPAVLRASGLTFGCGVIGLLSTDVCGVAATAEILSFMAGSSAGQCGPCVYGLRAIADATATVAAGGAGPDEIARIERWTALVEGRGACRHPDGAAQLMTSALDVFGHDFDWHVRTGRCAVTGARVEVA
jgi:NADH:ubiquinone oxidoreductase subunit F (NADH-binding)